jgi:DNA-binding NarL/FixJ family response regulator
MTLNVLLIHPSQLVRGALKHALNDTEFSVLGESPSVDAAEIARYSERKIDIAIVDIANAGEDPGIFGDIRRGLPKAKIVAVGTEREAFRLLPSVVSQIDGLLFQEIPVDQFVDALRKIARGETIIPLGTLAFASGRRATDFGTDSRAAANFRRLSERERQILRFLVRGNSNKAIARELAISEGTVKVHLRGLLTKIGLTNRTQAAIWALNHKVFNISDERRAQQKATDRIGK